MIIFEDAKLKQISIEKSEILYLTEYVFSSLIINKEG